LLLNPVGRDRHTDNIVAKRKGTQRQIMIYKILHRKLKIEQHEIALNWSVLLLLQSKVDTHKGGNKKSYIEGQTIQLPTEKG
jgi:hypothetical protein